jgi:hypothetical protein
MKEITADGVLVACCGLYCGACRSYLGERCPGCAKNAKATWCKVRACCKERGIRTCADCTDHRDPAGCQKFDTVISRLFSLVLRSDRRACVMMVREKGLEGFARHMAEKGAHTIKK